jgi:hypothetical protein
MADSTNRPVDSKSRDSARRRKGSRAAPHPGSGDSASSGARRDLARKGHLTAAPASQADPFMDADFLHQPHPELRGLMIPHDPANERGWKK